MRLLGSWLSRYWHIGRFLSAEIYGKEENRRISSRFSIYPRDWFNAGSDAQKNVYQGASSCCLNSEASITQSDCQSLLP